MNINNLNDTITLLKTAQDEAAGGSEFGWSVLYRAQMHIEEQINYYFAEAE